MADPTRCSRCGYDLGAGESYVVGDDPGERMHQLDVCFFKVKAELDELRERLPKPAAAKSAAPKKRPARAAAKQKAASKKKK